MSPSPASAQIDHLVVMASTLEAGTDWCGRTLGLCPGPGGQHALMGTHNRLLNISSPKHPQAYLEIIAIDPQAQAPTRRRWFDMDDPALRARVQTQGPQLVHFVVRVADAVAAVAALRAQGHDPGAVLSASRASPNGLLQWQITVRADGQRLFGGGLPTLIQWGTAHPTEALPACGISLTRLTVAHPRSADLAAAYAALGLDTVVVHAGPARLQAELDTPQGPVKLLA